MKSNSRVSVGIHNKNEDKVGVELLKSEDKFSFILFLGCWT